MSPHVRTRFRIFISTRQINKYLYFVVPKGHLKEMKNHQYISWIFLEPLNLKVNLKLSIPPPLSEDEFHPSPALVYVVSYFEYMIAS